MKLYSVLLLLLGKQNQDGAVLSAPPVNPFQHCYIFRGWQNLNGACHCRALGSYFDPVCFSRISLFFYDPCIVGKLEKAFLSLRRKMSQGRTGRSADMKCVAAFLLLPPPSFSADRIKKSSLFFTVCVYHIRWGESCQQTRKRSFFFCLNKNFV